MGLVSRELSCAIVLCCELWCLLTIFQLANLCSSTITNRVLASHVDFRQLLSALFAGELYYYCEILYLGKK